MSKIIFILFIIAIFSINHIHIHAQSVVHAESTTLSEEEDGFKGNIEVGINFVQNINDVFQTQNRSQFHYIKGKHKILSLNALNLTVFNESRILNDGFQHLRHGYMVNDWFVWETFGQAQYNEIIKIRGRYLAGTGPRFKLLKSKNDSIKVYASFMYMPEYEEETTDVINRHHRLNHYLSFGWLVNDKVALDLIGYFQPDMARVEDYRISSEFSLKISILERLSFKYSMALFYDTFPPEGIRKVFYNIRNTLSFDL